ncbi:MAG TPA: L-lactate dehydrogenase [Firmicutes bacterium]|nr:L-lactate dehydrogenase [Candidatus Fermentithermobacillaceae bacterium]
MNPLNNRKSGSKTAHNHRTLQKDVGESGFSPKPSRVVVVGSGLVGSTYAYTLLVEEVADEICIVDIAKEKAIGQALDLGHAVPFARKTTVWAGTIDDSESADIVVIAAGASQKPGETRMDLLRENSRIVWEIAREVGRLNPRVILLVVTNPVDVMGYVAWKASGLPSNQVMGSGTLLDTARLRWSIAGELDIDPRSVHIHVVGEHGDSETVAWSLGNVAGIPLNSFASLTQEKRHELFEQVRNAAYHIIDTKGATYYAIALGLTRLTQAILKDSRTVFSVSTLLRDCQGVQEVFAGMPCIVGRKGVMQVLELPVTGQEATGLRRSLEILKRAQESLDLEDYAAREAQRSRERAVLNASFETGCDPGGGYDVAVEELPNRSPTRPGKRGTSVAILGRPARRPRKLYRPGQPQRIESPASLSDRRNPRA